MIAWLIQNKEWLFSGVGVAVMGVLVVLISRMRHRLRNPSSPQIIERVEGCPQSAPAVATGGSLEGGPQSDPAVATGGPLKGGPQSDPGVATGGPLEGGPQSDPAVATGGPLVRTERIVPITPADIHNAIKEVVPLQQSSIKQRFVGLKVEWDTRLVAADENNGVVRLMLKGDDGLMFYIHCSVKYDDYRELGILPEGSLIHVYGEIEKVGMWSVNLQNVELTFVEAKRT